MSVSVQRYSIEDYHQWCDLPQNQGRLLELVEGEINEKMPSFVPSQIAAWIITYLNLYLREHPIGRITGPDGGYQLSANTVLIPDVGYISKARMPDLPTREAPHAPDLAVEIKSPDDSYITLREKALYYLKHGARLVWLIIPDKQAVEVFTADAPITVLHAADSLDGGDVLPGFTLLVSAIFADQ